MKFYRKIKLGFNKIISIKIDIHRELSKDFNVINPNNETKIFCIGSNKTGTTSLKREFEELGFKVGNQRQAELLARDIIAKDYQTLIDYCKSAQVFQDVPFSQNDIYKVLDQNFPNSKFVLSVRDSSEQWYDSLTKFHAKMFGNGEIPNWDVLRNTRYVYRGWAFENIKEIFGVSEHYNPYDKRILINHYENRNEEIIYYFKNRPNDLLVINLSDNNAYKKFCNFIGVQSYKDSFPWENKTDKINV
jgi:hypothetical protein